MALSGAVTLLALPAIITLAGKMLFKRVGKPKSMTCNCVFCLIISVAVVLLVTVNLHQYWDHGWGKLAVFSVIAIVVMALTCGIMSRRQACKTAMSEDGKVEDNQVSGGES
jgi:hypothetical protein